MSVSRIVDTDMADNFDVRWFVPRFLKFAFDHSWQYHPVPDMAQQIACWRSLPRKYLAMILNHIAVHIYGIATVQNFP